MKPKPKPRSRNPLFISLLVFVVVCTTVWAIIGRDVPQQATTLPDHLSVEALQAAVGHPGALRSVLRDEELTDEQRRELMRNMRNVRRSSMQERIDNYFAANEDDKQALLDEQIDEFQKRMKEMELRRKEAGEDDNMRKNFQSIFRNQSKQERKTNSESRNPDQTAQRMTYMAALRGRAAERGVTIGRPGGSGRGQNSGGNSRGGRP